MNGSVWIRARVNTKGKTHYAVVYRLGGRGFPQIHAGTFKTKALAEARKKIVEMDLALGLDPKARFAAEPVVAAPIKRSFEEWFDAWHKTQIHVGEDSATTYGAHRGRLVAAFGGRYPQTITQEEIQDWVIHLLDCEKPMKPRSIRQYWLTLRSVLRYAKVDPNPAEDINLPKVDDDVLRIMKRDEFTLALEHIQEKYLLLFRLLEATGTRISEPLELVWADVDWEHNELLLAKTKNGMKHWVGIPEPLMQRLAEHAPAEVDPLARIFVDISTDDAARSAWREACKKAKVAYSKPHSLRHRRISLWVKQGMPISEIEYRVGHLDAKETLETYNHVNVSAGDDEWLGMYPPLRVLSPALSAKVGE